MFPTTEQCGRFADGELDTLQDFDLKLREALTQARAAKGGDCVEPALVTVLLSVAADAAMLAGMTSEQPSLEDFIEAARDAFEWSRRKSGLNRV